MVIPVGFQIWVAWTAMVSKRLPLPASEPMNSGSGAAWLVDWRLLYRPLKYKSMSSVSA